MEGIFAVYKPVGITSHDVVNMVRRETGVKRVGHGGTLDPFAEGVLVIAVGRENTKTLDRYVKGDKEYVATLKLGFGSETDDTEGPFTKIEVSSIPKLTEVKKCVKQFIGEISQTPSKYSAIKVHGKEAYKRARAGEEVKMEARKVKIKEIEILRYEYPELEIRVVCGSGTYIRTLASDIGKSLRTGAYLTRLIRTKVGEFSVEDSVKIDNFKSNS